jgi:hypothetical protein
VPQRNPYLDPGFPERLDPIKQAFNGNDDFTLGIGWQGIFTGVDQLFAEPTFALLKY